MRKPNVPAGPIGPGWRRQPADYDTKVILRRVRQQERPPRQERVQTLVDEWIAAMAEPGADPWLFILTKLAEREIKDRIIEEDQL